MDNNAINTISQDYNNAVKLFNNEKYDDAFSILSSLISKVDKSDDMYDLVISMYIDTYCHISKNIYGVVNIINKIDTDNFIHKESVNRVLFWRNKMHIYDDIRKYDITKYDRLRFKFKNADKIIANYAQMMQDMFALTVTNGAHYGTYLEIGSNDWQYNNNTLLLEKMYDWNGISIDINEQYIEKFKKYRNNEIICGDALLQDYDYLCSKIAVDKRIDYLQLDIDPANITYECLCKIPFDKYRFSCITYEHDSYLNGYDFKNKAHKLLSDYGYVRVCENILCGTTDAFEDWYVDKQIINNDNDSKFTEMSLYGGDVNNIFFMN